MAETDDDDDVPRLSLGGRFYMTPIGHARLRENATS